MFVLKSPEPSAGSIVPVVLKVTGDASDPNVEAAETELKPPEIILINVTQQQAQFSSVSAVSKQMGNQSESGWSVEPVKLKVALINFSPNEIPEMVTEADSLLS